MANKFGRNYNLALQQKNGATLFVQPPFTLEFDITRNNLASVNEAVLRIYNLSQYNRNQLRKDVSDYGDLRSVVLQAGYGTVLPVVFAGSIRNAWSVRDGVNWITEIHGHDGGFAFANSISDFHFTEGTPQNIIIEALMSSFNGDVSPGAVGSYPGTISRGNAYTGSTTDLLTNLTGGGFSVDLGKAYCLGTNEVLATPQFLINSDAGLLGTPVREETNLRFSMIFEPNLRVNCQATLQSSTDQNFNGVYKVISLHHRGMISPAVCGEAITDVGLYYGATSLSPVELLG